MLARGEVQFVVNIPENFSRDLLRGDRPVLLVEADATDPAATSNAIGSLRDAAGHAPCRTTSRARSPSWPRTPGPVDLRVHARYNPEAITQYNIVPGLMGVVLTMTMVDDHRRWRSPASASAARWRTCSPCRRGRSRC